MIRLDKPNESPQVLLNRGTAKTEQDCEAYVENAAAYESGELMFGFTDGIYGCVEIRRVLETIQNGKCCYCESKPLATSSGRIDHFRPKGAVRQYKGGDRIRPGYYWLAYRWDNLVLACEECNLKKSDCFPLRDPEQRARNHLEGLDKESPLLLNPYVAAEPSVHLAFDGAACQPRTECGRVTVALLELNRPGLQEERQRVLNTLKCLSAIARRGIGCDIDPLEAGRMVESYGRPDAPYSAMVRDYLSALEEEN